MDLLLDAGFKSNCFENLLHFTAGLTSGMGFMEISNDLWSGLAAQFAARTTMKCLLLVGNLCFDLVN